MIVALAVLLGAAAQSVSGIGFGLICGPALVGALGQAEGVRLSLLLSAVVNVAILARRHEHARWSSALLLLVPAAAATPVIAALLEHVPEQPATVYFLALNAVGLATFGLPALGAGRRSGVAFGLLVGLAVGHVLAGRVGAETARRTTPLLAGAGGVAVLVGALV